MLGAEALDEALASGVLLKKEDGGLAVGPLEVGVTDLGAGRARDLAGRGLLALHEAGVGEKVLDAREALDVVELVEGREGEDPADAGMVRRSLKVLGSSILAWSRRGAFSSRAPHGPSRRSRRRPAA
jgi:hypothetical protein